ncbi:MAG: hypothetical protein ACYS4W_11410 [Planctomycetota bacterium]
MPTTCLQAESTAPEPPDSRVDTWDLAVLTDSWLEDTRWPPPE